MRIRFTQSGGFAGIVKGCTVDTAFLAEADRQTVEGLVAASGLGGSTESLSPGGRDRRQYAITIEGLSTPVAIVCDDACMPARARPLVSYLAARARPEAADGGAAS